MKIAKKIKTAFLLSIMISFCCIVPVESFAYSTESIAPRADIIEWRYKTENGKLYRRQFNYSKNEWVGDWEFVGNVS